MSQPLGCTARLRVLRVLLDGALRGGRSTARICREPLQIVTMVIAMVQSKVK
jgi:hypothetical protein